MSDSIQSTSAQPVTLVKEPPVIPPAEPVHPYRWTPPEARPKANLQRSLSKSRIFLAFACALSADLLQILLFPLFSAGFISPLDAAVDLGLCILLSYLLGWHIAFLPTFVLEGLPLFDLVPSWTLAVIIAVRSKKKAAAQPAP